MKEPKIIAIGDNVCDKYLSHTLSPIAIIFGSFIDFLLMF